MIAAIFFFRTRRFLETAVLTQGTVTELIEGRDSEDNIVYHPRVRFEVKSGESHVFDDVIGSGSPRYQPGDRVPVKYDPQDPEDARIGTTFRTWFVPGLLAGIGLPFFVTGLIIFLIAL